MSPAEAKKLVPGTKLIIVDNKDYPEYLKLGAVVTYAGPSSFSVGSTDEDFRIQIVETNGRGWRPMRFELYRPIINAQLNEGGNV